MLIALLTILFLGGSTNTGMLDFIANSEDAVRMAVEDDDRRKAALEVLKDLKKRTNTRNKTVKQASKDLGDALSSDSDVNAIWEGYFTQRAAYNFEMLNLREQLKSHMAREEWALVFGQN